MNTRFPFFLFLILGASAVGMLSAQSVSAATLDARIRFRPHCQDDALTPANGTGCPEFPLFDEETVISYGLKQGDAFDIDVVIDNPSAQPVQSVQSWIEYSREILRVVDVRIDDAFPLIAPGEQMSSPEDGLVKIGASNISGGMTDREFVFANVRFEVLGLPQQPVGLRFFAFNALGQEGRTKVLLVQNGSTVNILKTRPLDLLLYFGSDPPPTKIVAPSVASSPGPGPSADAPVPPSTPPVSLVPSQQTDFSSLQPSGLRVMTEGVNVYLAWPRVPDSRVAGYNVHYGAVSGRYIQRRTAGATEQGVTIRGLPTGERYYFALTAFTSLGEESEYSQEVAVTVGDPDSSTSPFWIVPPDERASLLPAESRKPQPAPTILRGETGLPLSIVLLSALALAIPVSLYWRRLRRSP